MSDRPAVTWLTSPPAKHLSVLGGDSSSPSPTPTHGAAQAARRTNGDDPADDQALPTSGIGAEAAGEPGRSTHELLRMLGVGGGCGVQGSERYAEPPRPPATAQRKRRRPLSIAFENSLSSPGVGFSSLMQECESVFAAGPSEGQRLDAGARPQTEVAAASLPPEARAELVHTPVRGGAPSADSKERIRPSPSRRPGRRSQRFARLIVLEVGTRLAGGPASEHEKAVRVLDETTGQEKLVLLRGEWLESELAPGDFIHVTAQTQNEAEIIVDSDDGVLIIHPDLLVPVTTISESFACLRRTVLKTRIKSRELNAPLVFGSVLHELFQNALRQRNFTLSFLHEACHSLLSKISDELFVIDLDEQSAFQQLQPMIDGLRQWAYTFLAEPLRDQVDPHVYTSASDLAARSAGSHSKVDSIVDIEEAIWCHTYGIKGHIDISATVRFGGASIPPSLAPVELKTSKTNYGVDSHRAQTMIYSLIMAEAYGVDIEQGLLAYVCRNESHQVPLRWGELRSMIIMRNSFASHSVRRDQRTSKLPEVVRNERICSKCYMLDSCLLYHKIEGGTASEFGPNPAIGDRMARINERHTLFYKQWDEFLSNEEPDAEQNTREFFILTSQERERLGRCISRLRIEPVAQETATPNDPAPGGLQYVLSKANAAERIDLPNCDMAEGDPVTLHSEDDLTRLGIGVITSIDADRVCIFLERPIKAGALRHGVLCRLDKDQYSGGNASVRHYLASVFTDQQFADCRRKIVDLEPPSFLTTAGSEFSSGASGLNMCQQHAVDHIMRAQDYALVLGMPGTGKTTVIAHVLKELVSRGKSVLLASYTHSAVDNILLKLLGAGVDFLRIGNINKIHPELKPYVTEQRAHVRSTANAAALYGSSPIVASTCLGLNHPVFVKRRFDYCIVDEASQIALPVCLGPVRLAGVFVLVGDHYQLPPIATSRANTDETPKSLFKHLSEAHPSAVAVLEEQYRMNKDIMTLASAIIYNSRLRCGTDAVATKVLMLPGAGALSTWLHPHGAPASECQDRGCWLSLSIEPSRSLLFLDTDGLPAIETRSATFIQNDVEAKIIQQIVISLSKAGLDETEIGVISPYRSQLRIISELLRRLPKVEVLTVDKYQGRDKECIVVSLVRSNKTQTIGELLQDWRRINVALTRAKSKLILVGSKSTLEMSPLFAAMFSHLSARGCIFRLPSGAHTFHLFSDHEASETQPVP